MSASVTVSIADDRIGMLSGISRVRKVLVSAWLGRTEDSSGCRSTSSNVSPSGIRAVSLSWAISAHDRQSAIRQVSLDVCPCKDALRRLEVHAFDHLVSEPLRAALEGLDDHFCALDLRGTRRKCAVTRLDLAGMDEALSVEPQLSPLACLEREATCVLKIVEDP